MTFETTFNLDTSSITFGWGATGETGFHMQRLGGRRVMVVADPHLAGTEPLSLVLSSLQAEGIETVLFDRVRVEPTDASFKEAIGFAAAGQFDGYVALGGGSTIDTAKAANLYATYPADFLTYVNAPIGLAQPVPGPLKPLIAIPTTAGTGSETTGVAIFDLLELHAKTGIAHRALRPAVGIVDPRNTRTVPPMVATCSGFDVLGHALESWTALPYSRRPAPDHPRLRPAYQGANPISDIWATRAIEMVAQHLVRAASDPSDDHAREQMLLAATFAGIGFGNAGVHLPHGMSYAVSGLVRDFTLPGYAPDQPLIPHGLSVILTAPAVFRFTAPANPGRHLQAAALLGADISGARPEDAGDLLAGAIVALMQQTGLPNGLRAVGYTPDDVDPLVAATLPQHRVNKLAPRPADHAALRQLFLDSMRCW